MTYSATNGVQLFVNGSPFKNTEIINNNKVSGGRYTITIGTYLQPNTCTVSQTQIIPSQFSGKIDELKIFSREISSHEISTLAEVQT